MIDLNATQAAIRAGYSVKTANEQGARLLTNVSVQAEIQRLQAEISRRTGISQDRVIRELAKIAFLNPMNLVTPEGRIRDGASQDDLSCIEGVKFKRSDSDTGYSEEREVKIASKLKALELLGKHLGMFNDKLDLNIAQPVVISGGEQLED
jgi:phage terminase small subunit